MGIKTQRSALLCSMPAVGHVGPMTVVGRELARRGWRVRLLTGRRYRQQVESAGLEFAALPPEADTLDDVGADERNRGLATINRGVEEAFIRPALPAAARVEELLAEEPADVVFHDMTFLGVQTLFSRPREERPLTVMCGIGPAGFSSRDRPPYGMGIVPSRHRWWGRLRDAALNRSARMVLGPAHRALDDCLERLGAPPLGGAFFMDVLDRSDILAQFTVPEFEYPRSDGPELRFYGPMTAPPSRALGAPPWWDELRPDVPVVHVTQGTVANTDFSELVEPTLTALADEDVRVVVTAGGADLSALPPLPANTFAAPFLDYELLLPRTSAFVTNGGYGGLHHAMRHGVPIVIAGDSEDKVETSARVQWSGAGVSLRTGRPTPEAVRTAVNAVLREPGYAATSRRIGRSIAASSGAPGLVHDVEEALRGGP
ncbi:glycosyltransferase family 1 protein [Leucobacter sp. CSA1]|uniref:Glycosyltransferase family 1 protein n=1 Tax=Leucobacter chromiisoli TaxID=2796471 RepID=A0A934Q9N1_9MICO|nr:glycosyltransferase [Leucobacter chromiisoli]MBK0419830.1 glycosyltransferase family 1 protein [Leucobacter chromiisoli]